MVNYCKWNCARAWVWVAGSGQQTDLIVFCGLLTMQDGEEVMRNLEQTEEKRFGIYIGKAVREILDWGTESVMP